MQAARRLLLSLMVALPLAGCSSEAPKTPTERGIDLFRSGKWDEAIEACTVAIQADPQDSEAFIYRGRAYHQKGDLQRAIADFSDAIRIDPKGAEAYYNRSITYEASGRLDLAKADKLRARENDPAYREAIPVRPQDRADQAVQKILQETHPALPAPKAVAEQETESPVLRSRSAAIRARRERLRQSVPSVDVESDATPPALDIHGLPVTLDDSATGGPLGSGLSGGRSTIQRAERQGPLPGVTADKPGARTLEPRSPAADRANPERASRQATGPRPQPRYPFQAQNPYGPSGTRPTGISSDPETGVGVGQSPRRTYVSPYSTPAPSPYRAPPTTPRTSSGSRYSPPVTPRSPGRYDDY